MRWWHGPIDTGTELSLVEIRNLCHDLAQDVSTLVEVAGDDIHLVTHLQMKEVCLIHFVQGAPVT